MTHSGSENDDRYDRLDEDHSAFPSVRKNPLNRATAFGIWHHTSFGSDEIQHNLVTGLTRIRDSYDDHALIIGGDQGGRGGPTRHYVIRYLPDAGQYGQYETTIANQTSPRETFDEAGDLVAYLQEKWSDDSFTCVSLVHLDQTVFAIDPDDWQKIPNHKLKDGRPVLIAA